MNPDSTLAVTNTCPKDGVHLFMDSLSIICIAVGILVIVCRGPLIFAPRAALRFYDRLLLSTNAGFRVIGVVFAILAMALLFSDFGEGVLAGLLHTFGWFVTIVALLFLVLPNVFRGILKTIFGYIEKSVDDVILRIFGFLSVVFGLALIYVGIYVV